MKPVFYYHPRMALYDFGPRHPLKPVRLIRAVKLIESYGFTSSDPGPGSEDDVLRVHSADYLDAVRCAGAGGNPPWEYGLQTSDVPAFLGMFDRALAYASGSAEAARRVAEGAPLAFNISGGLHHAQERMAAGFCVFNDCAISIHILRETFDRVAYIDIDVHHGDGVQWLVYDNPSVLTCSIHEDPSTLWPRTGGVEEIGTEFSALNVPLEAHTTGDVWLDAFRRTILPAVQAFNPGAIVLQMGTDSHFSDPLAHMNNTAQEWLEAVAEVGKLGIPIVALGGGGYDLRNVPRMWASAVLTLSGIPFGPELPPQFVDEFGIDSYLDPVPQPREQGRNHAEAVIEFIKANHLRYLQSAKV